MARRHQPDGTNEHQDGSAAFPESPSHGDRYDSPNGLTYVFKGEDDDGNVLDPGYWVMLGALGPQGPRGEQGPGGNSGSHPTINPDSGTWDLIREELLPDGGTEEHTEETGYPAQGTVRVLGIKGSEAQLPDADKSNLGDAFYIERYDDDGKAEHSELFVIPYHDYTMDDGSVDVSRNTWVNMGTTGNAGRRGEQGKIGPRGASGASQIKIVDFMPAGEAYNEGEMMLEKYTKTIFICVTPN